MNIWGSFHSQNQKYFPLDNFHYPQQSTEIWVLYPCQHRVLCLCLLYRRWQTHFFPIVYLCTWLPGKNPMESYCFGLKNMSHPWVPGSHPHVPHSLKTSPFRSSSTLVISCLHSLSLLAVETEAHRLPFPLPPSSERVPALSIPSSAWIHTLPALLAAPLP